MRRDRKYFRTIAAASLAAAPTLAQNIGPSTTVSPYVLPSRAGVTTTSVLTVGDPASNGYRMVGIPDGLGAFDGPNNKLTLLMNHELTDTNGIVRAGGYPGAFVSRWEIEKTTLKVTNGRDLNSSPSDITWSSQPARALSRHCTADLALPSAYRFGALGTDARIYLNGEESGNEGTGWAHVVTGPEANASFELPTLGRFSWEQAVACPFPQTKTLVVGLDDSTPGQVYVYVGTKTGSGSDVARAGLTNGVLYGVRVTGIPVEQRASVINTTFDLAPLGSQIGVTGAMLNTMSNTASVTLFNRPEDGAWDTRPGFENDFYFVVTDGVTSGGGRSRLYHLHFTNLASPELGGTIRTLLDGTEGGEMFDNICVDSLGRILLQEDVGNNPRLGKIWMYDTTSRSFGEIAAHDPVFFQTGGLKFLTADEESSGIIDASSLLGAGWFLFDVQAHYGIPGELVEGGQLVAMFVDPKITLPVGVAAIGRSSPGCQGPLAAGAQSIPRTGNANFRLTCKNAPANGAGVLLFSGSSLTTPITYLGLELWLDPTSPLFFVLAANSDASGRSTIGLPIPPDILPPAQIANQFVWVGPSSPPPCPPFGLSAPGALAITIQP